MDHYEELLQIADDKQIDVIENYSFQSSRIKGLYCNGVIAINKQIETKREKACVLAEELGHHETSEGNIIEIKNSNNSKQEATARLKAYNRLIGLMGLIKSYEAHCCSLHDTAEFLEVTEEFLAEALACYRSKYGPSTKLGKYTIFFEPCLGVLKMI